MFCDTEEAWLSHHNVQFTARDVAKDPNALAELEKLDVFSTPATLVDGKLVVGFDRRKLALALGIENP
jgi:thioredoxin reductase (NADPH)